MFLFIIPHTMSPTKKTTHDTTEEQTQENHASTQEHHESTAEVAQEISDKAEKVLNSAAGKIEWVLDEYAEKVTKTVESKLDPTITKKAKAVAWKVDSVADDIEDTVNNLAWFIPQIGNHNNKESAMSLHATYTEHVSRLFILRWLWIIIQWPICYIRSIWFGIIWIVQILHMLILGKRNKVLREKNIRYISHITKWYGYLLWLTDKEPKIIED